ncbi:MAG: anti-sigma factor family protein [Candidatus Dormibacteraceae bacterium]
MSSRGPLQMNCRQVVELMTDYIEGLLTSVDRARFEEHIAGCDGCRAYLAQLQATRKVVGRLADEPVPASVEKDLLEAFRSWRAAK